MSAGDILAMDGFEVGDSPIYFARQGTRSNAHARSGDYGSSFGGSGFPVNDVLFEPEAEVCVGVSFRFNGAVNGTYAFLTLVGENTNSNLPGVSLGLTTQKLLVLQTPDDAGAYIVRAVSEFQLKPDTWYYIELYASASASAGTVTVQVNGPQGTQNATGAEVMHVEGVRTLHHTATGPYWLAIYGLYGGFSSDTRDSRFDDFYLRAGDEFVGDCRVVGLELSSDRATDFTPLTGSDNFDMVNEVTADSDTSYNHTNVDQDQDIFEAVDVADFGTILAVQVANVARGTVADEWELENAIDLSGTFSYGDPQTLAATYPANGVTPTVFMQAPGALAWTLARLNALGLGYRTNSV